MESIKEIQIQKNYGFHGDSEDDRFPLDQMNQFDTNFIKQIPNIKVIFKITSKQKENGPQGDLEFRMFQNVPKTVENFLRLVTGQNEKGLTYKKTKFFKIYPGFIIQGGDVSEHAKCTQGGEPCQKFMEDGRTEFNDENFINLHKEKYRLTMANFGPNTNASQFMITLNKLPWLDGKHVCFGEVITKNGRCTLLEEIERKGTENGMPGTQIEIENCYIEPNVFAKDFHFDNH